MEHLTQRRMNAKLILRDFIQKNYTLWRRRHISGRSHRNTTTPLGAGDGELSARLAAGGVDMDTKDHFHHHLTVGYLDKEKETIVGFQTDKPFKRAFSHGDIRMAVKACRDITTWGGGPGDHWVFTQAPENPQCRRVVPIPRMRACRSSHIIAPGLPDAYVRGRIIGDYPRRIALYGWTPDRGEERRRRRTPAPSCVLRRHQGGRSCPESGPGGFGRSKDGFYGYDLSVRQRT